MEKKKTIKFKKLYSCSKCSYQTNRAYNVQRHLANHYEKPPKELQHLCSYAGCSFASLRWDNLQRHIQRLHRVEKPAVEDVATNEDSQIMPCDEDPAGIDEDPACRADEEDSAYPDDGEDLAYPDDGEDSAYPGDEEDSTYPDDEEDLQPSDEDTADELSAEHSSEAKPTQINKESRIQKQNVGKPKRNYQKGKSKSYSCNTCNYRTNRCYNIKRHIVKHKENPNEGILLHVCIISGCKFVTPRWDNLCRHVKRIHPDPVTSASKD